MLTKKLTKIYQQYLASKLLLFCLIFLILAGYLSLFQPNSKVLGQKTTQTPVASVQPSPITETITIQPSLAPAKLVAPLSPIPTFSPTPTPTTNSVQPTPTPS